MFNSRNVTRTAHLSIERTKPKHKPTSTDWRAVVEHTARRMERTQKLRKRNLTARGKNNWDSCCHATVAESYVKTDCGRLTVRISNGIDGRRGAHATVRGRKYHDICDASAATKPSPTHVRCAFVIAKVNDRCRHLIYWRRSNDIRWY